ncbi:MAG TPA: TonB family protein, partial [Steroidobacteraceae bacterium]
PAGDSLASSGNMAGSPDERILTTVAWNTEVHYLSDSGSTGTAPDQPLLVDEPPAAQPGPQDEEGAAKLRGPEREELWVTPDTRAATLAPYLDGWRRKVERIGTINYPTAASGGVGAQASPVVEVGLAANGTLERVLIRRSSGNAQLDQAALAILKLASPFDPFPPEMAAQYRVLRFAYEWQFVGGRVAGGTLSTVP